MSGHDGRVVGVGEWEVLDGDPRGCGRGVTYYRLPRCDRAKCVEWRARGWRRNLGNVLGAKTRR